MQAGYKHSTQPQYASMSQNSCLCAASDCIRTGTATKPCVKEVVEKQQHAERRRHCSAASYGGKATDEVDVLLLAG